MVVQSFQRWFAVLALAFTGATLLAFSQPQPALPTAAAQEGEPPAGPTLEERVKLLESTVAEQQKELTDLRRVAQALVEGAARLTAAGEQARLEGFAEAGANPSSRTALLDGIAAFGAAAKRTTAPEKKQ